MTEFTLQIRYSQSPQRPVCARFIAHGEPVAWLDELTTWGVPLDTLRLYPVPRSRSDNSCLGVLVSVADAASVGVLRPNAGSVDARSHSGELRVADAGSVRHVAAYGLIANRLFLPVEAALSIALSAAEWRELLGSSRTMFVWHPRAGLVAFDPGEVLTVADLLSPHVPVVAAPGSPADWSRARVGVIFQNHIVSLRAELPESVAVMLVEGRDDIGTLAKPLDELPLPMTFRLKELGKSLGRLAWRPFEMLGNFFSRQFPPSPRSTRQSSHTADSIIAVLGVVFVLACIAVAARSIREPLLIIQVIGLVILIGLALILLLFVLVWLWDRLRAMGLFTRKSTPLAQTRVSPTGGMLATIGAGLQRQMANVIRWTTGLLDARQREVDRLMRMLDENPDEGLKYALPMGGDAARGIAPPSDSLVSREIDFQLNRPGSGGPADLWVLPVDTQYHLIKRYRELAAREVQLGRYRRAAYIHAELLGDLTTAATTLVNGRFYREAAVLYRDKLNRPLDAAHCLEQGGLLLEAIPLYRQQGMVEKVGDLYRRLEDHEQADSAYREAVDQSLVKHDHLDAARLLQEKLDSPDEALAALDAGWPESLQARNCLKNSFTLLSKLGRHDDAVQRIRDLRQSALSPTRAADAIDVLASTAVNAPHAGSRLIAADTVRVMAARVLAGGHVSRQQITAAVGRLAPEDLLLARDCTRFTEKRSVDKTPAAKPEDDFSSRGS